MLTKKILLIHGIGESHMDWADASIGVLEERFSKLDITPLHWFPVLRGSGVAKTASLFANIVRVLLTSFYLPSTLFYIPWVSDVILSNLHSASLILGYPQVVKDSFDLITGYLEENIDAEVTIIAHSLGSILAYEYIRIMQPANVSLLITLGSPIDRQPIRGSLLKRMEGFPPLAVPWKNVWGDRDLVVCWRPKASGAIDHFKLQDQHKVERQGHGLTGYVNNIPSDWINT
jgi:pimeloyl-ACP methyl ester carboxylesterase